VVEWCDSRDGGAEGDLAWFEKAGFVGVSAGDGDAVVGAALEEPPPNILLKNPGLSLACGADDGVPSRSLDFS